MRSGDLISRVKSFLGLGAKAMRFRQFTDGMGNFSMLVPAGWKCDEDIAVVEGKYTISFQPPDGLSQFSVSIDAQVPPGLRFTKYAKSELESPSSGIYTPVRKSSFHKMPAFVREYCYTSGGRRYFGGGVMFFSGAIVYSLSWSAPQAKQGAQEGLFARMKDSFSPSRGFVMRKATPPRPARRNGA
ncbi:hypothetical protein L0Y65_03900 [Candidatus Micrarchaeota archaeon]|nr:hypothetical protein [Candidatus Micrarchaeota archaeon]